MWPEKVEGDLKALTKVKLCGDYTDASTLPLIVCR